MLSKLRVPSFAKINWSLKILGRRSDGYHELQTTYQTINLHDDITFELNSGERIELIVRGKSVTEGRKNLVYQAALLLCEATGQTAGVKIVLEKKIPVGAGLGGGSSNAAIALITLNRLWKCNLSFRQLEQLAKQLGSDVPFFLTGGTALGIGRGERVIPLPDMFDGTEIILIYPNLVIETVKAYLIGNWRPWEEKLGILTNEILDTTIRGLRGAADQSVRRWFFLENDFEVPIFGRYPVLPEIRDRLKAAGCKRVMLCGSGSTLMGMGGIKKSRQLSKRIGLGKSGEIFFCRVLSRTTYKNALEGSALTC